MVTHNIEEAVLMSDRILVFSSNPGRILAEIKVDLPQPRHRLDPKFRQLVDDIYARMTARPAGKPAREGLFELLRGRHWATPIFRADPANQTYLARLREPSRANLGGAWS